MSDGAVSETSDRSILSQVLTVASGTAIAQTLLLAATPLLTRIYEPYEFGVFGTYSGIVLLLAAIASGRYEIAIPLARTQDRARNLLLLSLLIGTASSVVVLALVALFRQPIADILQAPELRTWLWFVPLTLLLTVSFESFMYWNTRLHRFHSLSIATASRSATTVAGQIGAQPLGFGTSGLLAGQVVGASVGTGVLVGESLRRDKGFLLENLSHGEMRSAAHEYRGLPLHALSTSFLNALSVIAVPVLLAVLLDPASAGLVVLSLRVVVLPTQVFGQAIWQVVHARLGPMDSDSRDAFLKAVNRYSCHLYAFPMVGVAVFADLAPELFGADWRLLSQVLPPIALMVYLSAVSNSTSYFAAWKLYRQESVTNIVLAAVRLVALVAAAAVFGIVGVVLAYGVSSSVVYVGVLLFWSRRIHATGTVFANLSLSLTVAGVLLGTVRLAAGSHLVLAAVGVVIAALAYYTVFVRRLRIDPAFSRQSQGSA